MELVKVCAFALMGVLLALQFKGGKQEYGIYLGAALAVVVFSCTLSYMGQAKKQRQHRACIPDPAHPFLYGTGKKTADGIMAAACRWAKLSDTSV